MFAEKYKKAYQSISPALELQQEVLAQADSLWNGSREEDDRGRPGRVEVEKTGARVNARRINMAVRAAAAFMAIGLGMFKIMPAFASHVPAFYRVIESISPVLADRLVPVEKSCSSQGITMEVEAVALEGREAEIIVSMRDDEGSTADRIHGQIDLFDSYELVSYGGDMTIGGSMFLYYDDASDKAYFKITAQSSEEYRGDKLRFAVREILCDKASERRQISLKGVEDAAATRVVEINGMSGMMEEEELPESLKAAGGTEKDAGGSRRVLDLTDAAECAADGFTVTGGAYMDGVLRLQICMGDTRHADRHVQPFLVDAAGKERSEDYSISWQETVGDTSYQFYEYWFVGGIEDLTDYSMYGIFHSSGEWVEGDWKVIFRIA